MKEDEKIIEKIFPYKRFRLRASEWFKIPFSLLWASMFYFGVKTLFSDGFYRNYFLIIIVTYMFLAILYILFGRFIIKYIEINHSEYVITDSRLIMKNNFWKKEKSIGFHEFKKITLGKYNKAFGYLIFGEPKELFGRRGVNYADDPFMFDNIKNPEAVMASIKKLKSDFETKSGSVIPTKPLENR